MGTRLISPDRLPDYGIRISERHRRRLEARGEFPKRVQITGRTHGYVEDELIAFSEAKIAERDGAKAA
jgi:predicted DNA-binding transcriptional regulator AlpA